MLGTSIVETKKQARVKVIDRIDVPFGREKMPLSDPLKSALLNWLVNWASEVLPRLLLASTYFLTAWRLWKTSCVSKKVESMPSQALRETVAPATVRCCF